MLKQTLGLLIILLLAACQSAPATVGDAGSDSAESAPTATAVVAETAAPTDAPTPSPTEKPTDAPTAIPTDEPTAAPTIIEEEAEEMEADDSAEITLPFSDAEIEEIMDTLTEGDLQKSEPLLALIVESGDEAFIPVLIETLRFGQLGVVRFGMSGSYIRALQDLSGQNFGNRWDRWVEWYGATDIEPPESFKRWKGSLLQAIDPRFGDFFVGDGPDLLRIEEVQWGGVRVDGIPALDNPAMISAAEATFLEHGDPVFGIEINGDARAYPLRILDWHEMANDVVGGVPVSLAYCTLCGAAIAYDGRASDGNEYTFGSSGFLYRSNKLMYDRPTNTLWNQLTGEPVMGNLAGQDVSLDLLPVVLTTWAAWQVQHPETVVVDENTGFDRDYTLGSAYARYFSSEETMFPVWQRDEDILDTKDQVYALRLDGIPKAYPIEALDAAQVVNDTLGSHELVLIANRGIVDVEQEGDVNIGRIRDEGATREDAYYTAGSEVRVYERGTETFSPSDDPALVLDSAGREWQITEEALIGPEGESAERVNGHLAYWYGWYAFYPETELYGGE